MAGCGVPKYLMDLVLPPPMPIAPPPAVVPPGAETEVGEKGWVVGVGCMGGWVKEGGVMGE